MSSSSPFLSALPCQPFLPSANEMPLPLIVRARIIVGRPLVRRASSSASRISARSWPSTMMACHPKRLPPGRERVHVVLPLRRAALAERVDVGDGAERVEAVEGSDVCRFPHRALRRFAVAEQHVGAVVRLDAPRVERDADAGTQPLPKRPGGDVDPGQPRRRVPFEIGIDAPQREQILARDDAGLGPRGVEDRRGVALREDEPIVVGVVRIARVVPHLRKEERSHDLGRRAAGRRMAAAGLGRRDD